MLHDSNTPGPKKHDYSKTLNLPESDVKNGDGDGLDSNQSAIPLRAALPLREPRILRRWQEMNLYEQTQKADKPMGTFVLHDGPPYSNNSIHLGTSLNKLLKDLVVKSKSMAGYRAPYVPGWDNHGLPIETAVTKEFREKKIVPTTLELRKRCREFALHWVDVQREQFKRLGVNGNWDNPYLTLSSDFEAEIVGSFKALVEGGYIYRGLKPVQWCPVDRTALADAEIEYEDKDDTSIYVRFSLHGNADNVLPAGFGGNTYAIIWTTTPWTIPANLALAVHPENSYVLIEHGGDRYIVAAELAEAVAKIAGWEEWHLTEGFSVHGAELVGLKFQHPLYDRLSPIVTAEYVTISDGTGIVHTAPGHGREDFETGQRNNLDVLSPVDDGGRFTAEAGPLFEGQSIWEGNKTVVEALKDVGALVGQVTIRHSYPHCWRCHNPVIFRATRQWFMDIDHNEHRDRCLAEIAKVQWFPPESVNRISAMVGGRPDWCLSRQRAWGVGIPVFYCTGCEQEILDSGAIGRVEELVREHNSDVWFEWVAKDLLPDGFTCPHCGGQEFSKESDIFDVWFDSGTTNRAVLASGKWPELTWPADVYLEGGDQHRGWFNSSLMIGVATKGAAPYRQVITNGWTLDEKGRAMHKSLGNAVAPEEVTSVLGADVLRLWVASTDYFEDVRLGKGILAQTGETYRRFRNTLRFGLSNIYDFDPANDAIPFAELREIDRYALHRLAEVVEESLKAYDRYEFHRVTHAVHQLAAVDLSAFYFDVLKDTLYAEAPNSYKRRSAQTAVYEITKGLVTILAPILSFTCDEVWEKLKYAGEKPVSAQIEGFPNVSNFLDSKLAAKWQIVLNFREEAYKAIEIARQAKEIGKPLEAHVIAVLNHSTLAALQPYAADLAEVLLVSRVDLSVGESASFSIVRADGVKCARCWLIKTDVNPESGLCGRCAEVLALS